MSWVRENRHLLLAWLWVVLAYPGITVWKDSIVFVILLSLYANFETSLGAHEARKAQKQINK